MNNMKAVTAEQMKKIDIATSEQIGIPSIVLMENAAREVCDVCLRELEGIEEPKVVIFAGKGNNGGDGFALARQLHDRGVDCKIVFLFDTSKFSQDAEINYNIAIKCGVPVISGFTEAVIETGRADIVVDAVFGTGISRKIEGMYAEVIEMINTYAKKVISIDIPSGVNSDDGRIMGTAVEADITVTFALPKIGLLLYPGASCCGDIKIANISIQPSTIDEMNIKTAFLDKKDVYNIIPKRQKRTNKGDYGRLFVIAGSKDMTGALALCCKGAFRSGAGLVYACTVRSGISVVQQLVPEAVVTPLSEYEGMVRYECYDEIKDKIQRASAIAVGPGLGMSDDVSEFVKKLIYEADTTLVIDADGLNAIADDPSILLGLKHTPVITPHPGEMSRLTGLSVREILEDTVNVARDFAVKYNCVTVLKDARSVIAAPDGRVVINITGNPSMSTGGSGDVLTGVISSFIAQGIEPFFAAAVGAYIHGLSGDISKEKLGTYGVMAWDIAENVAEAIKRFR